MKDLIEKHADKLMDIVKNPQPHNFFDPDNQIKLKGIALQIDASNIPFHQAFNVVETNPQQLLAIQNEYIENSLIGAYNGYDADDCPLALMSFRDNSYWLEIRALESIYVDKSVKHKLTRDSIRKIFHNILSYGVIPRDSINNYKVRLA